MKNLLLSLSLLLITMGAWALPREAQELQQVFKSKALEFNQRYNDTVKALPERYALDVTALRDNFQQQGDLDGVLATTAELNRFNDAMQGERDPFELTPEMPLHAIVARPEQLYALQNGYLNGFTEASKLRQKSLKDLASKYTESLVKMQQDLTRSGRIEDAVLVRQEVERMQNAIGRDEIMQLVARFEVDENGSDQGQGLGDASEGDDAYDMRPDWAHWKFQNASNFSRDRTIYGHPDIPNELYSTFNHRTGQGRFYGTCRVRQAQIGMAAADWFGKALLWRVDDASKLNAVFVLSSRELSAGRDHGPSVSLAVLAGGRPLKVINVNLQEREITLRLVKDANSDRCALIWSRGRVQETFELPKDGEISVLLGVTVRNPGEMCETSLTLR